MIELNNISFSYGEAEVLKNLSLKVRDGECVCIKGESGCGKTTALRLIAGLEVPTSGTVTADGDVSVVFQEDRLIEGLSLKRNLSLVTKDTEKLSRLISKAGLSDFAGKRISSFSGGMKRRAAIIRAIAFGGDALLLDEPFNGLDSENKRNMAELINENYLDRNKPVLLISHIEDDSLLLNARVVTI